MWNSLLSNKTTNTNSFCCCRYYAQDCFLFVIFCTFFALLMRMSILLYIQDIFSLDYTQYAGILIILQKIVNSKCFLPQYTVQYISFLELTEDICTISTVRFPPLPTIKAIFLYRMCLYKNTVYSLKMLRRFFLIIINKMVLQYHCDNKSNLIENQEHF